MFELQWSAMGDYRDASDTSHNQSNAAGQQEPGRRYVRQRPHTTQSPINDVDPEYVTRERYQTLEQSNQPARAHRDMGRATSNPEYMPPIEVTGTAQAPRPSGPAHPMSKPTGKNRPITHSDRYLQTLDFHLPVRSPSSAQQAPDHRCRYHRDCFGCRTPFCFALVTCSFSFSTNNGRYHGSARPHLYLCR